MCCCCCRAGRWSSFSNHGSCVDIHAPGSSITAAWTTSDDATRTISGTSTLSQHSFGTAIDIYGFTTSDGADYILERDWEHGTSNPSGAKARVLYEIGQRMYNDHIFNIILTPNYNSAHDNHFHVDLTPGSHTIRFGEPTERYIGPDQWERCGNH